MKGPALYVLLATHIQFKNITLIRVAYNFLGSTGDHAGKNCKQGKMSKTANLFSKSGCRQPFEFIHRVSYVILHYSLVVAVLPVSTFL